MGDRLRIAITTNTLDAGGAERQRVYLANELARRGYSVHLVVLQRTGPLEHLVTESVKIVRQGYRATSCTRYNWIISGTTNTEIYFAARNRHSRRAARWSVALHNPISANAPKLPLLVRLGAVVSDDLIALTPDHAARSRKHWNLRPTHTIPNGVQLGPAHLASGARQYDVGYIGRLAVTHKGIDRLLAAVAITPELRLLIAGTGPDDRLIRGMIEDAKLSGRVDLAGHLRPEDFYAACKSIAVLSRWEGQPLVLLEARYRGKTAVVSHDLDMAQDEYIIPVDGDDVAAVAGALTRSVLKPSPAPDLTVGDSIGRMVDNYVKLLSSPGRSCRQKVRAFTSHICSAKSWRSTF